MNIEIVLIDACPGPGEGHPSVSRRDLHELESRIMSKISELKDSFDAAMARVNEDVATLQSKDAENQARIGELETKVADLQAQVDAGGLSAADQALVDEMKGGLDSLDPLPGSPTPTPTSTEIPPA